MCGQPAPRLTALCCRPRNERQHRPAPTTGERLLGHGDAQTAAHAAAVERGGGRKPAEEPIRRSRASRRSAGEGVKASASGPARTLEGQQHPDRNTQLRSIDEQVTQRRADREPAVSSDAQKKEPLRQLPGPERQATDGATGNISTQRLSGTWRTSPSK
ncbi:ISAzo13-like element transposase-related protein [Streptomyces sp. DT203]|uniref:ISAzo13-like element transposase-related protein n=1 Tax=Streptomyces sp. DT203 TaxID=3393424 RepID=UPI003CF813DB